MGDGDSPALKKVPVPELVKECGIGRSALFEILPARSRRHRRNRERILAMLRNRGLIRFEYEPFAWIRLDVHAGV